MDTELGRLRLLAAASDLLTTASDPGEALGELAALFVPAMADWAVVDVIVGPDLATRKAVVHRDPSLAPPGRFELDLPRLPATSASSLVTALREGTVVTEQLDSQVTPDCDLHREQLELFRTLGASCALVVPLLSRRSPIGALTLVRIDGPEFGDEEIALVEGVARRTALAVDNSRLYAHQIDTALAFQRSLLPALPQPDHLQLASRYVPAREGAALGGDWYDAFTGPDGQTFLVIGDVVGHDQHATAHMSELRNLLRGCAWHAPPSPAAVLERLNQAVCGLQLPVVASVMCARLQPVGSEYRLEWASAGHLPPLLVEPGGPARLLSGHSGVLLGVTTDRQADDNHVVVSPGSKLVLYTDGLVEHRGDLAVGLERLEAFGTECASEPLERFCDQMLQRLSLAHDDDIAVLAVQFSDSADRS
ncbi:MAG TPA: SpoIIE family protein phosphatase [Acidimicrobiales bacterium]|nr:SpoIIE family protein phosphatase [Acidimicrobiales bacterium]